MRRLLRVHAGLDVLVRDVLEQRLEVDLLLVARAERHPRLLADDRDHRRVVELGVVEPVEEVDRPGARGRHAHADLARQLRVPGRGEGRDLLVARLDELEVGHLAEREVEPVRAVARIRVHARDAPLAQALQHEGRDVVLGHRGLPVPGRVLGRATRPVWCSPRL
jgi:hypothetical protein